MRPFRFTKGHSPFPPPASYADWNASLQYGSSYDCFEIRCREYTYMRDCEHSALSRGSSTKRVEPDAATPAACITSTRSSSRLASAATILPLAFAVASSLQGHLTRCRFAAEVTHFKRAVLSFDFSSLCREDGRCNATKVKRARGQMKQSIARVCGTHPIESNSWHNMQTWVNRPRFIRQAASVRFLE